MQFANTRQADRLALEAARQKVEQDKLRNSAIARFQGLLTVPQGPLPPVMPIQTPQGRAQAIGLLGQIAPDAMAQAFATQMFRTTEAPRVSTALNTFRSLNPQITPGSEEERTAFADWVPTQESLSPLDQLRMNEITMSVMKMQQDFENAAKDRQSEEGLRTVHTNALARDLLQAWMLNNAIEGTFLSTGTLNPLDWREGFSKAANEYRDFVGEDSTEYRDLLSKRERFENTINAIVASRSEAASAGLGRTDAGRSILTADKPSINNQPAANRDIISRMLADLVAESGATGIYLDPSIERQIEEIVGSQYQSVPGNPQAGAVVPPGAAPVSLPPMPDLSNIDLMDEDEIDAAIKAAEEFLRARGRQ
jgi:hypothetical protein